MLQCVFFLYTSKSEEKHFCEKFFDWVLLYLWVYFQKGVNTNLKASSLMHEWTIAEKLAFFIFKTFRDKKKKKKSLNLHNSLGFHLHLNEMRHHKAESGEYFIPGWGRSSAFLCYMRLWTPWCSRSSCLCSPVTLKCVWRLRFDSQTLHFGGREHSTHLRYATVGTICCWLSGCEVLTGRTVFYSTFVFI